MIRPRSSARSTVGALRLRQPARHRALESRALGRSVAAADRRATETGRWPQRRKRWENFPAASVRITAPACDGKLGLLTEEEGDFDLAGEFLDWMKRPKADFTNSFAALTKSVEAGRMEGPCSEAGPLWTSGRRNGGRACSANRQTKTRSSLRCAAPTLSSSPATIAWKQP